MTLGTIQPKPRYRTPAGKFRAETAEEFRARHDGFAWALHLEHMKCLKMLVETNPYTALLVGSFPRNMG